MFKNFLLVGLGGMLGSILRYGFYVVLKQNNLPIATLLVNIIGSICIGIVMAQAAKSNNFFEYKLFLAVGVCGGFTTFSAFSWDNVQLLQQQKYLAALAYTAISVLAGLAATILGYKLFK